MTTETENKPPLFTQDPWSLSLLTTMGVDVNITSKVVITFEPNELVRVDVTHTVIDDGKLHDVLDSFNLVRVQPAPQVTP